MTHQRMSSLLYSSEEPRSLYRLPFHGDRVLALLRKIQPLFLASLWDVPAHRGFQLASIPVSLYSICCWTFTIIVCPRIYVVCVSTLGIFYYYFPYFFLKRSFPLNLSVCLRLNWLTREVLGSACLQPSELGFRHAPLHPVLNVVRSLHPDPHACTASTFPAKPCPRP
jgi:hypothetical protein